MATGAQIQSALADARLNDVSYSDRVLLIQRAIDNAMFDASGNLIVPITSAGSDGVSVTISLDLAFKLMDYYRRIASGGVVPQYVEFKPVPRTPWMH